MPEIVTFQQAIETTEEPRHLLLSNGFSRAYRNDIFSYDALFERADFEALSPAARNAFGALDTTDSEVVMRALKQAARLAAVYLENNPELAARLNADSDSLRELLANTIALSHPERPGDIAAEFPEVPVNLDFENFLQA